MLKFSISWWFRGRSHRGCVANWTYQKKWESRISWRIPLLLSRATFGFASPRPSAGRHQHETHASPLGPGAVLLDHRLTCPRDQARFFKNRTEDIEIDPKSIYVHMSWPDPDRPPPGIREKSSKFMKISTCSILFEILAPWLLPQRHRTINNAQNIHFFSGKFNWPSN